MRDRWYLWMCGWALLAAAGATAWPGDEPAPAGRPGRTIRVDRPLVVPLDEVVLSCERPGILWEVPVREGDTVSDGQLLAKLKDDVAKAALAVAEAEAASDVDIRYAQAATGVAQLEYERMQDANRRVAQAVPDVEVRKARLAAEKAALEIEKATQAREVHLLKRDEAAVQLETYRIEAPFDGFVSRVYLSRGASVKQGDPVIELVNTKKVRVEGYVAVGDLARVRRGSAVVVQLDPAEAGKDAAKQAYPGKVVFVDVKSTPAEHMVRVWAEVDNLDNTLRPGLTPTMTILPAATD